MSEGPSIGGPRRRLLIIAWAFPPTQAIGAIRVSKFARYLRDHGWDTKVVAGSPDLLPFASTLREEIPREDVHHVHFFDPISAVSNRRRRQPTAEEGESSTVGTPASGRTASASSLAYRVLRGLLRIVPVDNQVRLPDRSLFWRRAALREARALAVQWRPDALLSSHGPPGPHLVASRLARDLGIPWVADYRDPWSGHYGRRYPALIERLEEQLERAVLRPAASITSVSPQLARHFATLHGKPTTTVYNGFDEEDYVSAVEPAREFVITYTGIAEAQHRDPEPLFAALALLRRDRSLALPRLRFVGSTDPGFLTALAERHGVHDLLQVQGTVPLRESVELQRRSTALLVLNWIGQEWGSSTAGTQTGGILSGKLVEYLGARRPILAIGAHDPGVSEVLARTNAGVWAGDAASIAAILREWITAFAAHGELPYSANEAAVRTFSRQAQAGLLAKVLDAAVTGR